MKILLPLCFVCVAVGLWLAAVITAGAEVRQQVRDDDDPISFDAGLPEDD